MLDGRRVKVRLSETPVDLLVTDVAYPVIHFKKSQGVNFITLRVDRSTFRRVVLYSLLLGSPGQATYPLYSKISSLWLSS